MPREPPPDAEAHHRALEAMYHAAPCNEHYRPRLTIEEGAASVRIPVREELHHAAGAVHGTAYMKALDDACFFAANSLVPDVFVLTADLQARLLRPVVEGELVGHGRVVHAGGRLLQCEGRVEDADGRRVAFGTASFMRSRVPLDEHVGYK